MRFGVYVHGTFVLVLVIDVERLDCAAHGGGWMESRRSASSRLLTAGGQHKHEPDHAFCRSRPPPPDRPIRSKHRPWIQCSGLYFRARSISKPFLYRRGLYSRSPEGNN